MHTRENAGISSESGVRISAIESLRFPGEGSSAQGKSGPKSRAKAVDDGQQVDIPAPPTDVNTKAMTQKDSQTPRMVKGGCHTRLIRSEVRESQGWVWRGMKLSKEADEFTLARKVAREEVGARTANRHR